MQQALRIDKSSRTLLIIVAPLLMLMATVYVTPSWLDLETYFVTLLNFLFQYFRPHRRLVWLTPCWASCYYVKAFIERVELWSCYLLQGFLHHVHILKEPSLIFYKCVALIQNIKCVFLSWFFEGRGLEDYVHTYLIFNFFWIMPCQLANTS